MKFKSEFLNKPIEERIALSNELKEKHPSRIPIILVSLNPNEYVVEKFKLLAPRDSILCLIYAYVRKQLKLTEYEAIYLFIVHENKTSTLPLANTTIQEYMTHKDGFLYIGYAKENTFG